MSLMSCYWFRENNRVYFTLAPEEVCLEEVDCYVYEMSTQSAITSASANYYRESLQSKMSLMFKPLHSKTINSVIFI